ncbi:MAG: hypothetical protein U1F43_30265 [Myxococcota bacterium]
MVKRLSGIAGAVIGLGGALALAMCGGTTAPDAGVSVAPEAAAVDTAAPVQANATHVKLGFAYTANLLGELEPCG